MLDRSTSTAPSLPSPGGGGVNAYAASAIQVSKCFALANNMGDRSISTAPSLPSPQRGEEQILRGASDCWCTAPSPQFLTAHAARSPLPPPPPDHPARCPPPRRAGAGSH